MATQSAHKNVGTYNIITVNDLHQLYSPTSLVEAASLTCHGVLFITVFNRMSVLVLSWVLLGRPEQWEASSSRPFSQQV